MVAELPQSSVAEGVRARIWLHREVGSDLSSATYGLCHDKKSSTSGVQFHYLQVGTCRCVARNKHNVYKSILNGACIQ